MATASVPLKYPDDVTVCPACSGVFKEPRVLSCMHTFCLHCIEGWQENKQTVEKIQCRLCREKTTVADGVLDNLPKNIFVTKLLDVKELLNSLSRDDTPCDVCGDDKGKGVSATKATKVAKKAKTETSAAAAARKASVYCIDCRHHMCDQCSVCHEKFRFPIPHNVIELDSELKADDLLLLLPESKCDKHLDKSLEIYCFDCKQAVCMMCYIKSHNSHKCSDVKEVAEDLSNQMKVDGDGIMKKVEECQEMLLLTAEQEKSFRENITNVEKEIIDKAENLKKLIEEHKTKLLEELTAVKEKQIKQIEAVRREVEDRLVMIENFKKYCDELRANGTACDIAKSAGGLRDRAKVLLEFDVSFDLETERISRDVKFTSSMPNENLHQIFGALSVDVTIEGSFMTTSRPIHMIQDQGQSVVGVTSLDNELFVIRYNATQVQVYDAESFALKRNLSVPLNQYNPYYGYGYQPRGLAACSSNKCIYVSEQNSNVIHKIGISDNSSTQWSVGGGAQPYGLSVTKTHNVLVACYATNSVKEYTTDGAQVREIILKSNITNPVHVVELPNDHFGIIHHGSFHRYCEVDKDGEIVKSFGCAPGAGAEQLYTPHGLVVNDRGHVFIADQSNNRILSVHPESPPKPLVIDGGLSQPYCVHLDKSRGRLYIGEWSGARIIVLGRHNVKDRPN